MEQAIVAKRPRSWTLDSLRIFAALMVVAYHWSGHGGFFPRVDTAISVAWIPDWLRFISSFGYLGVDFFFILSGAVISQSAVGKPWAVFSTNRFLRLFPAYFMATAVAIVVAPFAVSSIQRSAKLINLTTLDLWTTSSKIIGAAWSLTYEIRFYALVAAAIVIFHGISKRNLVRLISGFLVIIILAPILDFPLISIFAIAPYGAYFALGAVIGATSSRVEFRSHFFPLLVAFLLSWQAMSTRMIERDTPVGIATVIAAFALSVFVALAVASCLGTIGTRGKPRLLAAIATLALMTYPIYLLHETVGLSIVSLLVRGGFPVPLAMIIVFAGVLLVSFLSVKQVEPFARKALRKVFAWG